MARASPGRASAPSTGSRRDLLARSLGAHVEDEFLLAETLAERIGAGSPLFTGDRPPLGSTEGQLRRQALGLYPRLLAAVGTTAVLLAAVGTTAVRVAVEHWCVRQDEAPFEEVFRSVFDHVATGLPGPVEPAGPAGPAEGA
ncbi:hypothetical protein WJ438_04900 [Streptomyces sp. GD-15H]|uniref:hypothetical protein n=1 Tax=Streptomyces sp. GD-15H TaxID=3129112 RepID=UPI0032463658